MSAQNVDFPAGSYYINMGVTPQTIGNGLKPYGLIYDLLKNDKINIWWYINPDKPKDGIDLTVGTTNLRGGVFIIPAYFRNPAINAKIASWQAQGVVGLTSSQTLSLPIENLNKLRSAPRWTLDKQNGAVAVDYYTYAGIPPSAHGGSNSANWLLPSELGECDDLFIMPHADPAWATHQNLVYWNRDFKGAIWAACHAASTLENMVNPDDRSEQSNFLTTKDPDPVLWGTGDYADDNSLVLYNNHGRPTQPYVNQFPNDPVAQYMGVVDGATNNGSEKVYIPRQGQSFQDPLQYDELAVARWNEGVKMLVYDPTHSEVTNPDLETFRNVAGIMMYGRAFDNPEFGWVMYEAGHAHDGGTGPENIAAMRAFFNFSFLAMTDKTVVPEINNAPEIVYSGEGIDIGFEFGDRVNPNLFQVEWRSTCGGTFDPPNGVITRFTPPIVASPTQCLISVTITDGCTRGGTDVIVLLVESNPSWSISKTSTKTPVTYSFVGEVIPYEIALENTGDVSISSVNVSDPLATTGPVLISGDNNENNVLNVGEVWIYEATYTVTQADIDNGSFTNIVTATGTPPAGTVDPVTDDETVFAVQNPQLSIEKTITTGNTFNVLGQSISYSYRVTNSGNVTLEGPFEVTDDKIPSIPTQSGTLAPGEFLDFTATYTVTQTDIQNAFITNTAFATGIFNNSTVQSPDAQATATLQTADLSLIKTVSKVRPNVGETVTFSIQVTNNGPTNATDLSVADLLPNGFGIPTSISNGGIYNNLTRTISWSNLTLLNGSTITFTFQTLVLGPGAGVSHLNYAEITGMNEYDPDSTPNNGSLNEDDDDTELVSPKFADLSVIKRQISPSNLPLPVSPASIGMLVDVDTVIAGTKIYYFIQHRNLGPDTSFAVTLQDFIPAGLNNVQYSINFGNSWTNWSTGTNNYLNFPTTPGVINAIIRGDVAPGATGTLTNNIQIFSASTYDPDNSNNTASEISRIVSVADLLLNKTQLIAPLAIGGQIIYKIDVRNLGPSNATGVIIHDEIDADVISDIEYSVDGGMTWLSGWSGQLSVGDFSLNSEISILIRGNIIDKSPNPNVNPIPNTATVTSTSIDPDLSNNSETINSPLLEAADIEIVKTGPELLCAGELIIYTITARNLSNTFDATNITVTETLNPSYFTNIQASFDNGMTWINIANASAQFSLPNPFPANGTYTILLRARVRSDISVNQITNTILLESDGTPDPDLTNNMSTWITDIQFCSDIKTEKTLVTDPALMVAGEPVEFLITFTNYGPSIARNLTIEDILPPGIIPPYTFARCNTNTFSPWTGTFVGGGLEAGGVCFINLKAYLDPTFAGSGTNTACVTSSSIDLIPDDNCDTLPYFVFNPSIEIVKTADKTTDILVGETVTYTYNVTNTGNAPLSDIVVTDIHNGLGTLSSIIPLSVPLLLPSQSVSFSSEYVITQADIDANLDIENIATVSGQYESWTYTDEDNEIIDLVDPDPQIQILKSGQWNPDFEGDYPKVGDLINYSLLITNTGNTSLYNPQVSDPLLPEISCPSIMTVMLPGDFFTCTGSYIINQSDLDAGHRDNTASVTATDPFNDLIEDQDTEDVSLPQNTKVSFIKKGSELLLGTNNVANPGDVIRYDFELENSGNVTLSNINIEEQISDFTGTGSLPVPVFISNTLNSPPGTLQAGEKAVYQAYYNITQSDINTGYVNNRAKSTADGPNSTVNFDEDLSDSSNPDDPNETNIPSDPNGDDPTFTFIPQDARIAVVKSFVEYTKLENSNFDVRYKIKVGNPGNLILQFIRLEDDVISQLGSAYVQLKQPPQITGVVGSPMIPVIGSTPLIIFDGTGGRLAPGEIIELDFVVEVDPDALNAPIPLLNQAYAEALPTDGMNNILGNQNRPLPNNPFQYFPYQQGDVIDLSDSGTDIYTDNQDDPGDKGTTNDPTPTPIPSIDVAKALINIFDPESGVIGNKNLTFRFRVQNTGNTDLTQINLFDTLRVELYPIWVDLVGTPYITFSNATITPQINPLFDGLQFPGIFKGLFGLMEPGEIVEVVLTVEVDPNKDPAYTPLFNQATVVGLGRLPKGGLKEVTDMSDDGYVPDGLNSEFPGDEDTYDDPTPIIVPELSVVKKVIEIKDAASNVPGHLDVNMEISIKNVGNVALTNLSLKDTIELTKYCGSYFVGLASGGNPQIVSSNATVLPTINTLYSGRIANADILLGNNGMLLPEQVINIRLTAEINSNLLPKINQLWNRATASGIAVRSNGSIYLSASGEVYRTVDDSDAGTKFEDINEDQQEDQGTEDDETLISLQQLSIIGDFVWNDLNYNGLQDATEPGLKNIPVELYNSNNERIAVTETNILGNYLFTEIPIGSYYLKFILPQGYFSTRSLVGANRNIDSDITDSNGQGTTNLRNFSVGLNVDVDAGFYPCIQIGQWIWYDVNKNDIRDKFENGLNGLKVNLYRRINNTWVLWESTYSGHKPGTPSDDGWFNFCVPVGQYYIEIESLPYGLVKARANQGADITRDSDITDANGKWTTSSFSVTVNQNKLDIGAGFYPQAIVGNLVWIDENLNGQQDDFEPGVEGVVVKAYDAQSGDITSEGISNSSGVYELDELEKKSIYISFTLPEQFQSYSPTLPRLGPEETDSDVDGTFGAFTTRTISMQPGDLNQSIDLGIALGLLPLEWINVNVSLDGKHHLVQWETAREINVSHFTVERKLSSEIDFQTISGQLNAGINNSGRSLYSFTDENTSSPGLYVYRIKQTDYDGDFTMSREVSIQNLSENKFFVYPNPVKEFARLHLQMGSSDIVRLQIMDASSRVVQILQKEQLMEEGIHEIRFDTRQLPPGIYMVQAMMANNTQQCKLIVLE